MKAFFVFALAGAVLCVSGNALAYTNGIPYTNSFETAGGPLAGGTDGYTNGESVVDANAGWYATSPDNGTVVTQSYTYAGEYPLPTNTYAHTQVLGFTDAVTNMVEGGSNTAVWIDCMLRPTRTDEQTPEGLPDAKTMIYFNSNGYPVVWGAYPEGGGYSNAWHTSTTAQVSSGEWARVTVHMNLESEIFTDAEYFRVFVDNKEVNFPLGMLTAGSATTNGAWLKTVEDNPGNNKINSVTLQGTGEIDDLQLVLANPITLTTYTITSIVDNASAATITPPSSGSGGTVTVTASNSIPFTITALGGYTVTNVYVSYSGFDGWLNPMTNPYTYTMTNIVSDGYIKVFTEAIIVSQTTNGTPHTYYDGLAGLNTSGWTATDYQNEDDADNDSDGMFGWQEYLTGTDASDSNSYFRVLGITYAGVSNLVTFFGPSAYGAPSMWSMYRSADLVAGWDLINTNGIDPSVTDPGADGTNEWWDLDAPGTAPVFYRPSSHVDAP